MTKRKMAMRWLSDAYAMERSASDVFSRYAGDVEEYPDVQEKFLQFRNSADKKAESIHNVIEDLGGGVSALKSAAGKMGSILQSAAGEFARDKPVTHMIAASGMAGAALGSYLSLSAAGEDIGEMEITTLADQCVEEAREAAEWLKERIPTLTADFLEKEHEDKEEEE